MGSRLTWISAALALLPWPTGAQEARIELEGGVIDMTVTGASLLPVKALERWATQAALDVEGYLGRFPVPRARLIVRTGGPGGIGNGRMFGDEGALIRIAVGKRTTQDDLVSDWVATHEMVHLAFPDVGAEHLWIEEGLATYVEPLARARRGRLRADEVWGGLVENLPKGLADAGRGFDASDSWGSTYWGGALYWLLADVEIRERSEGRQGLAEALGGILAAGGDGTVDWDLLRTLDAGDRSIRVPVLRKLYEQLGKKPVKVDLEGLWRRLGIRRSEGGISYDDKAPLAAIRLAILAPPPPAAPKTAAPGS